MFDPETLRTFISVAETGSFSKAAERLCKTTATISYRIKLLEENTGVGLFFRTTRSVQAVASLLSWLNARYPFTQFHFSRQIYMGVWDSLLYEGFSLAIGVTGTEPLANTFMLDPLGSVQWRFVMSADHPLAHVSGPLTEAQLRRFPAINIEDSARTLTKRVAWRLPGQKEIIVPDMDPQPLCQTLIDKNELVSCTIPTMRPPSPLSLAWHKFGGGKAVEDIVKLFTQRQPEIAGFLSIFNTVRC